MVSEKLGPALYWITNLLSTSGVPFQISGGFAAHLYGATRPVNDIDIEVPDSAVLSLAPHVTEYTILGPTRYQDTTWDLLLMTLNYEGQEIDICGADSGLIFNKNTKTWDPIRTDLFTVVWMEAFGLRLPVQAKADLIEYKSKIGYEEHKHLHDVAAVQSKHWDN